MLLTHTVIWFRFQNIDLTPITILKSVFHQKYLECVGGDLPDTLPAQSWRGGHDPPQCWAAWWPCKAHTTPPPRRPPETSHLKTKTEPKQKQWKVPEGRTTVVRTHLCMCKRAEAMHIHTQKILYRASRWGRKTMSREVKQREKTDTIESSSALKQQVNCERHPPKQLLMKNP